MMRNESSSKCQQQAQAATLQTSSSLSTAQHMSGASRRSREEDDLRANIHLGSPFNRPGFSDSFLQAPPTAIVPGSAEDVSSELMARYCLRKSHFSSSSRKILTSNVNNNEVQKR